MYFVTGVFMVLYVYFTILAFVDLFKNKWKKELFSIWAGFTIAFIVLFIIVAFLYSIDNFTF